DDRRRDRPRTPSFGPERSARPGGRPLHRDRFAPPWTGPGRRDADLVVAVDLGLQSVRPFIRRGSRGHEPWLRPRGHVLLPDRSPLRPSAGSRDRRDLCGASLRLFAERLLPSGAALALAGLRELVPRDGPVLRDRLVRHPDRCDVAIVRPRRRSPRGLLEGRTRICAVDAARFWR